MSFALQGRKHLTGRALLAIVTILLLQDAQDPSDETTTTNGIETTHSEEEEDKFFGKKYQRPYFDSRARRIVLLRSEEP